MMASIVGGGISFQTINNDRNETNPTEYNKETKGRPTSSSWNSYSYAKLAGDTSYDLKGKDYLIDNLDYGNDIEFDFTYYIGKNDYDDFNSNMVNHTFEKDLDYINFYIVTDQKSISDNEPTITSANSWKIPVDSTKLVFDTEVTTTVTLKWDRIKEWIKPDDKKNVYGLVGMWGNPRSNTSDTNSLLYLNKTSKSSMSYQMIKLQYNEPEVQYDPEIYFISEGNKYYWYDDNSKIRFSYDLSKGTVSDKVTLNITDANDSSFSKDYDVTSQVGTMNSSGSSSEISFKFEDYKSDYWNRRNLKARIIVDWHNTITGETGKTSSDSTTLGHSYYKITIERLDVTLTPEKVAFKPDENIIIDANWVSKASSYEYITRKVEYTVTNTSDSTSRTYSLYDDKDNPINIPHSGSKQIIIDPTSDTAFYVDGDNYEISLSVKGKFAPAALEFKDYNSPASSFYVLDEDINIQDQGLNLSMGKEVKYGEDITLSYEFKNLTVDKFTEVNVYVNGNTYTRDDVQAHSEGSITLTQQQYVNILEEGSGINISADYTVSYESVALGSTIDYTFSSINDISNKWLVDQEDGINFKKILKFVGIVLAILVILVIIIAIVK